MIFCLSGLLKSDVQMRTKPAGDYTEENADLRITEKSNGKGLLGFSTLSSLGQPMSHFVPCKVLCLLSTLNSESPLLMQDSSLHYGRQ